MANYFRILMEVNPSTVFIMIPAEDLEFIKKTQQQIIDELEDVKKRIQKKGIEKDHVSPDEFMYATGIKRWKFDQLISTNSIKTIKKKRKIYVPVTEIERYFKDPSIQ